MNPRNDAGILCQDDCPSWWNCDHRGCYTLAKVAYAEHRPQPQPRYQDEQCPDGRYILKDNQGYYSATRDELEGGK